MKYLYLFLECILYALVAVLYLRVFGHYRYHSVFEKRIELRRKTPRWLDAVFLGLIGASVLIIVFTWRSLYPDDTHHIGYFLAFFTGMALGLFFFRRWIDHVDLALCLPSIVIIWALLLAFETIVLGTGAGWNYTGSTVMSIPVGPHFTIILENVIFFYVLSPFMSILFFTGLAWRRSDKAAFFLAIGIVWVTGILWEYVSIANLNLWTMYRDRSILPINLFGAHTTLEELLYYVPFASISILIYLMLYYRKYRFSRTRIYSRKRRA